MVEFMAHNYRLNCLWVVVNISLVRLIKKKTFAQLIPKRKRFDRKVNQQIDFLSSLRSNIILNPFICLNYYRIAKCIICIFFLIVTDTMRLEALKLA